MCVCKRSLVGSSPHRNRTKTWFDQAGDPRAAQDRLLGLVRKHVGRPLAVVGETRRMSYLSPDDQYLCALDANLEAHRKETLERETQVCVRMCLWLCVYVCVYACVPVLLHWVFMLCRCFLRLTL